MGNAARQQRNAAVEREPSDARLSQAKSGVGGGDDNVAAEHHFHAAAQRMAVDARDDRNVERIAPARCRQSRRDARRPNSRARSNGAALHIRAGAERALAGAGQHDDANIAIHLDRLPDADQFGFGRPVDCIEPIGPVERDARDPVLNRKFHAHASTPELFSAAMRSAG